MKLNTPHAFYMYKNGKIKSEVRLMIKGNVLLVDDDKDIVESMEIHLKNEGLKVYKAYDGIEALEILLEKEIHLILMDIMMPVMGGYEATRQIRRLDKTDAQSIPIIALTANAFAEDRIKSKEAGMNEHLAKPLESEVLIKTIANYCGKVDHFK